MVRSTSAHTIQSLPKYCVPKNATTCRRAYAPSWRTTTRARSPQYIRWGASLTTEPPFWTKGSAAPRKWTWSAPSSPRLGKRANHIGMAQMGAPKITSTAEQVHYALMKVRYVCVAVFNVRRIRECIVRRKETSVIKVNTICISICAVALRKRYMVPELFYL